MPKTLEDTLNDNVNIKVIIPVHFSGVPCEMEKIKNIADKNNAMIIEDAAHALGARYSDGSMVGSCKYSDMTGFSFHPVKSIAAGEGGMITTNNKDIYRRLIRLRSHGINKSDDALLDNEAAHTENIRNPWYMEMQELGYNYRITDIQCALANSQLKKLPDFIKRRKELAKRYDKAFLNFEPIKPAQSQFRDQSSHHLYVIKVNFDSGQQISRATLMTELHKEILRLKSTIFRSHPIHIIRGSDLVLMTIPMHWIITKRLYLFPYYSLTNTDQDKVIRSLKELLA